MQQQMQQCLVRWCSGCNLRIAPAEVRVIWRGKEYHKEVCYERVLHQLNLRTRLDPEPPKVVVPDLKC